MKEFKKIVEEFEKIKTTHQAALATVVRVRGSSYRSPGARMLIRNDGRWTGSISGGCLEGDALRQARQIMRNGEPRLVTYDTMDDANNSLGVGLGCNGIIDVFIEPIDERNKNNPISRLRAFSGFDDLTVVATIFRSSRKDIVAGSQLWLDESDNIKGNITDESLTFLIEKVIRKTYVTGKASIQSFANNSLEVFFEIVEPAINLIIFGGGFDAKPVTSMASVLGWHVTVTDECIAHVAPINFPEASVSFCKRENFSDDITVKPYSAAILMSHTYDYDLAALKMLLKTEISYIGILGPKKRTDKMFLELKEEGKNLTASDLHRIHSPIGLDIGAETPEEIALSIVTEIKACFTNRSGGFLKYRKAAIHHRDGKEDQVFRQVFLNTKNSLSNNG